MTEDTQHWRNRVSPWVKPTCVMWNAVASTCLDDPLDMHWRNLRPTGPERAVPELQHPVPRAQRQLKAAALVCLALLLAHHLVAGVGNERDPFPSLNQGQKNTRMPPEVDQITFLETY